MKKFVIILTVLFISGTLFASEDRVDIYNAATEKVKHVEKIIKTDAEWRNVLTPEQYYIMRENGTERPFSQTCAIPIGKEGRYQCVGCGTDIFAYHKKFDSGTGWPSFYEPVSDLNIKIIEDHSHGMVREEVRCARCDSHLGHVFNDGPPPTGKRYCINALVLKLAEE